MKRLLLLGLLAGPVGAADTTPLTYRLAFQPVKPVTQTFLAGGYLGVHRTPALGVTTLQIGAPAVQVRVGGPWAINSYFLTVWDISDSGRNKVEIRPTIGLRYDNDLSDRTSISVWTRLEARFQDVGAPSSDMVTRGKIRFGVAQAFGPNPGKPGSFYAQFDVEPAWRFDTGFVSNLPVRMAIGYVIGPRTSLDLRYVYDMSRVAPGRPLRHSGDQLKLTWNYLLNGPHKPAPFDID